MAVSASGRQWRFPPDIQVDEKLLEASGGSLLLARLLARRGICSEAAARVFLDPSQYRPAAAGALPDMDKAVARVNHAIAKKEHVTVYGDYDVDGVTAASLLLCVLRKLGADVDFYIPNRTGEGYGLNLKAVSILASKRRTKLIITCDCGVSNFAEVNFAHSLGVDTVITDHHTMPEMLPPAVATLHPKLLPEEHPLFHLPGVGVAYKLGEALLLEAGMPEEVESLLDLVTLGMIADLVPLVRENRYLVQTGLPKLIESPRPGIKALLAQVRTGGGTDVVGFGLAPRINAVGRLSDAGLAVELMTTQDPEVADKIAQQLQVENSRRQEICDQIMASAEQMLNERPVTAADKAIVIYKEGWHHGVVGIVASRLVEKYHKPVFIGELDLDEQMVRGSARGVAGVDLYEVLKANEHLLTRWGGHKMAAGFAVEAAKAEVFCRAVTDTCNGMLAQQNLLPVLEIDAVVAAREVSMDLVKLLAQMAPFGMDNKKPVLAMLGVSCTGSRSLGKEGKHSRIMLRDPQSGNIFESVMWNSRNRVPAAGQVLDVAFNAEINDYNGLDRLQLVLADWIDCRQQRPQAATADRQRGHAERIPAAEAPQTNAAGPGKINTISTSETGIISDAHARTPEQLPDASSISIDTGAARVNDGLIAAVPPDAVQAARFSSVNITWKDLRGHTSPLELLSSAWHKLEGRLAVFNETLPQVPSVSFVDRSTIARSKHLLLWQFPPSMQVFKELMVKSQATNIYLLPCPVQAEEAPGKFLTRLLGLVRFAVNKRDGKAQTDKLQAALGTTGMAIALGLTVLRKLNVADWFAEEGFVYLDLLGQPVGTAESLSEFAQLAGCLKEIQEFRLWCAESSLKEIQLAVTPNQIEASVSQSASRRLDEFDPVADTAGIVQEN